MSTKSSGNFKMGADALEKVAGMFRVLGEEGRLSLLQELQTGQKTVGELVDASGQGQASVSKHLKLMFDAGFVSRRKEGVKVFYSLKDETVFSLCHLVCGKLKADQKSRGEIDYSI